MTLRTIRHLGYQIPDLAWLKLREIEYFFDDDPDDLSPPESDAAFSF